VEELTIACATCVTVVNAIATQTFEESFGPGFHGSVYRRLRAMGTSSAWYRARIGTKYRSRKSVDQLAV